MLRRLRGKEIMDMHIMGNGTVKIPSPSRKTTLLQLDRAYLYCSCPLLDMHHKLSCVN